MASRKKKKLEPTGILEVDGLPEKNDIVLDDYLRAVSAYILKSHDLGDGPKKSGQIRLSNALAKIFSQEFKKITPKAKLVIAGERKVAGALRTVKADVSEMDPLDGLRLGVELKPVNLAVGRAIWNRFGDLRTFAVNLHLKFPFCVVGGVLVIPTIERVKVSKKEIEEETGADEEEIEEIEATEGTTPTKITDGGIDWRSTRHLIQRAIERLMRAGGRENEGDAAHLLEGIAVLAYDPFTAEMDSDLPPAGSKLRWSEFVQTMAAAYDGRFEK